jgi:hypothetical protein
MPAQVVTPRFRRLGRCVEWGIGSRDGDRWRLGRQRGRLVGRGCRCAGYVGRHRWRDRHVGRDRRCRGWNRQHRRGNRGRRRGRSGCSSWGRGRRIGRTRRRRGSGWRRDAAQRERHSKRTRSSADRHRERGRAAGQGDLELEGERGPTPISRAVVTPRFGRFGRCVGREVGSRAHDRRRLGCRRGRHLGRDSRCARYLGRDRWPDWYVRRDRRCGRDRWRSR